MTASDFCFGGQIQGQRDYQEDNFSIQVSSNGADKLLVLCDGMGGHVGGATASSLAVQSVIDGFSRSASDSIRGRLHTALQLAHQRISEHGASDPQLKAMGTTLVAVFINGTSLHWISVGDSPLWLLRNNQLQRLNQDHSLAAVFARMVELGSMSAHDAATDPKRHALRSVVSAGEIKLIDLPEIAFELLPGDKLLLASDGLETLSDDEIVACYQAPNAQLAVSKLLNAVDLKKRASQDNTTVVCYTHSGTARPEVPSLAGGHAKRPAAGGSVNADCSVSATCSASPTSASRVLRTLVKGCVALLLVVLPVAAYFQFLPADQGDCAEWSWTSGWDAPKEGCGVPVKVLPQGTLLPSDGLLPKNIGCPEFTEVGSAEMTLPQKSGEQSEDRRIENESSPSNDAGISCRSSKKPDVIQAPKLQKPTVAGKNSEQDSKVLSPKPGLPVEVISAPDVSRRSIEDSHRQAQKDLDSPKL